MSKFSLQHTVLYAKNWYKHTDDFWSDMRKCLEADGYVGTFEGETEQSMKRRIAHIILLQFERLPYNGHSRSMSALYDGTHPKNTWKYGYFTNHTPHLLRKQGEELPPYDREEAVVRYVLSNFASLHHDDWDPCIPDWKGTGFKAERGSKTKAKKMFKK